MDKKKLDWNTGRLQLQADVNKSGDLQAFDFIGFDQMKDVKVLDIGCSDGTITKQLFNRDNVAKVVGLELSQKAVDTANEKNKPDDRFNYICKDIFDWETKEKFDVVYISFVLHHLGKYGGRFLEKVSSFVKGGGHVIVKTVDDDLKLSYPDEKGVTKQIFALYEQLRIFHKQTENTDRFNAKKTPSMLAKCGLTPVKTIYFTNDTVGKSQKEKDEIYEVLFGFRNIAAETPENKPLKDKMKILLEEQKELFKQPDYYFSNTVFWFVGKKMNEKKAASEKEENSMSRGR